MGWCICVSSTVGEAETAGDCGSASSVGANSSEATQFWQQHRPGEAVRGAMAEGRGISSTSSAT